MKNIFVLLILSIILFILIGCSEGYYADSSNWSVTDEEFVNEYYQYYLTNITALAEQHNIDFEVKTIVIDEKGYRITFNNDFIIIYFSFYNTTSGYGKYGSYYHYFDENLENLIDYSKHEKIVSFLSDVNSFVSFDYQGGKEIYHELYLNYLAHDYNAYYYHYDEVVGQVGYIVHWGDNYSKEDNRWNISFKFHSLLKPIN